MFDTNRSYCLRLAELTFPLLSSSAGENNVATAPKSVAEELALFFGAKCPSYSSSVEELAAALELRPDVQSKLAVITQYTPSKWLLEQELKACGCLPTRDTDAYQAARIRGASGMCMSGGGIRSATFNLGILQALARDGRIGHLTYLSSVSGGGYIHQFLANWIYRTGSTSTVETLLDPIPNKPVKGSEPTRATVQPEPLRWLRRYSNYLAPRKGFLSLDTWTIAATWTRNTALNFVILLSTLFFLLLIPHLGTMELDFLARNTLFLKIAAFVLLVLFSGVVVNLGIWLYDTRPPGPKAIKIKLACASLLAAAALVSPAMYRSSIPGGSITTQSAKTVFAPVSAPAQFHYKGSFQQQSPTSESVQVTVDSSTTVPGSRLSASWSARPNGGYFDRSAKIGSFLFMLLCGWLLAAVLNAGNRHRYEMAADADPTHAAKDRQVSGADRLLRWTSAPYIIIGIIAASLLMDAVRLMFFACCFAVPRALIPSLAVILLPALMLSVPFIVMEAGLGLLGRDADSGQREWMARLRAFSFILGGSWFAATFFSLLGFHVSRVLAHSAIASYSVWGGWLFTTIGGVLSARSSRTAGSGSTEDEDAPASNIPLELLARIAPSVFIAGLLILVSTFVSWLLFVPDGTAAQKDHRFLLLFFASSAIALLFGWRVDINDFSMHAFYRDRLARCYAGAVDPHRVPNLFTGFTRLDRDLRVHQLLPADYRRPGPPLQQAPTGSDPTGKPYDGPFPIFCTSINLTMGEDLAYQERKAASFAFTPLFSGYNVGWTAANTATNQFNGFVDTTGYVYTREGGLTLATACAISGAAASPSMGFHSNPAIAFLLTVFNVRLGWWLRNPRRRRIGATGLEAMPVGALVGPLQTPSLKQRLLARLRPAKGSLPSSPRFGLIKLLNELLGQSDDTTAYIYLTDGGHFENMGLYELLRRRCRTIIVSDAEADAHLVFEGIGMAIRKARLDFGIEITLDQTAPVPGEEESHAQKAKEQREEKAAKPSSNAPSDPATPSFEARQQQSTAPTPYVVSAHMSSTEPPTVTGTIFHDSGEPPAAGLSSFGQYPDNPIHCVYGTIRYPEDTDPADFGHILYIKASLTGDEPSDLLNYRRQHPHFPHDTTLNQFFTESQFESYRRLGEHIPLADKTVISWLNRYLKPRKTAHAVSGIVDTK
jgi:hypothetical protein